MNIYQFESYTEALLAVYEERKAATSSLTLSGLANQCLIQPSYLTNVLKGRADLNTDQLYRLCELLNLNSDEGEFLGLLLEHKKTQYDKRRNELAKKIRHTKSHQLRAEKNISAQTVTLTAEQTEKYYLDPYIQITHIYLTIPKGAKSLPDLARKFSVAPSRMQEILKTLEEIGYIQKKGKNYEVLVGGRHLPRESPILRPHQSLLRMKSLEQMLSLPSDDVYSFSATISTTPEVRTRLQAEYLKFLKNAEKLVKSAPPERLYQINFDLFPWEKDGF